MKQKQILVEAASFLGSHENKEEQPFGCSSLVARADSGGGREWEQKLNFLKSVGFSLENIVYLELLRRGYRVNIGKHGKTEVDFVAEKLGVYTYFQVTADMTAKETFDREIKPLNAIHDNYEKIILTADRLTIGNYNGVQVLNLPDWLLNKTK